MIPGRERIVQANPVPLAGGRIIAAPFQFYLDGTDHLRLEGWNTLEGCSLELSGRFVDDKGVVQALRHKLTLSFDRTRNALTIPMGIGYLLNLVVVAIQTDDGQAIVGPLVGQTFARVTLIRGFSGATIVLGTMLQGYVTQEHGLGWPGSPIVSSLEGDGYLRNITGSLPAAGAQITETVPTAAQWQLLRVAANLATAAGGANRFVRLEFYTPTVTTWRSVQPTSQAPSTTGLYSWAANAPIAVDATNLYFQQAFPQDALLQPAEQFATSVTNMAAGDQWTQPRYMVREWLIVG